MSTARHLRADSLVACRLPPLRSSRAAGGRAGKRLGRAGRARRMGGFQPAAWPAATAGGSPTSRSRACIAPPARSRWSRRWRSCPASRACRSTARAARRAWSGRPQRAGPSAWLAALQRAGYGAVPAGDLLDSAPRMQAQRLMLWRWLVAGFCMMQVMMYAVPAYMAGPGEITPDIAALLRWASWVLTLPVVLFSCWPFFAAAWRDLRNRPRRHGRAGGAGHRSSPSAPARPPRSTRPGRWAGRSGTTRSPCSSSSCCPGACSSSGCATAPPARWRR